MTASFTIRHTTFSSNVPLRSSRQWKIVVLKFLQCFTVSPNRNLTLKIKKEDTCIYTVCVCLYNIVIFIVLCGGLFQSCFLSEEVWQINSCSAIAMDRQLNTMTVRVVFDCLCSIIVCCYYVHRHIWVLYIQLYTLSRKCF